ncbi:hypothetical protein GN958_ATG11926 [Phytophthora infestans]|uniref:Uncharacterized protein n=1 Tax=Phytophthora infestans TaxID=4787 RepID=A0A8S9UIE4_PHYIN|nr:hypothetical protein GN958_ATG11926 [Phytophthora infestans]
MAIDCVSSYRLVSMGVAALLTSCDRCLEVHYGGHNDAVRPGADVAFAAMHGIRSGIRHGVALVVARAMMVEMSVTTARQFAYDGLQ